MASYVNLSILQLGTRHWNTMKADKKLHEVGINPQPLGIEIYDPDKSKIDLTNVIIYNKSFKGIDLSEVTLKGSIISSTDFTNADFKNSNLEKASFRYSNLTNAKFYKSKLKGVDFTNSNLQGVDLSNMDLSGANFSNCDLVETRLHGSNLTGADLNNCNMSKMYLVDCNFRRANLQGTNMKSSTLHKVNFAFANLTDADLSYADLRLAFMPNCILTSTKLIGANMKEIYLSNSNLTNANLIGADISDSLLNGAICVGTNFTNCNISQSSIHGISIWDIKKDGLKQQNLKITKFDGAEITVDNLELAQFIYLILNNEKIREVIGTIAQKGVLILGRFTPERKIILDAIRNKLRELNFVPIMFDFKKVTERDFTETIKILCGLSRFVIVDITNPNSSPLELQAIVPDYKIPFIPIIKAGEQPFSMFSDLQKKYNWVLNIVEYQDQDDLIRGFQKGILERALDAEKRLQFEKNISDHSSLSFTDFQ